MSNFDKYNLLLMSKGIRLSALGIREFALKRSDALEGLMLLRQARVPVLGGDVYLCRDLRIEPAYANWHTEQALGEDWHGYLRRSWDATEAYLESFHAIGNAEAIFVLVPAGHVLH